MAIPGIRSLDIHTSVQRSMPLPNPGDLPKTPKATGKEEQSQQPERTQKPAEHLLSTWQSLPPLGQDSFHTSDLFNAPSHSIRHAIDVISPAVAVGFDSRTKRTPACHREACCLVPDIEGSGPIAHGTARSGGRSLCILHFLLPCMPCMPRQSGRIYAFFSRSRVCD